MKHEGVHITHFRTNPRRPLGQCVVLGVIRARFERGVDPHGQIVDGGDHIAAHLVVKAAINFAAIQALVQVTVNSFVGNLSAQHTKHVLSLTVKQLATGHSTYFVLVSRNHAINRVAQ